MMSRMLSPTTKQCPIMSDAGSIVRRSHSCPASEASIPSAPHSCRATCPAPGRACATRGPGKESSCPVGDDCGEKSSSCRVGRRPRFLTGATGQIKLSHIAATSEKKKPWCGPGAGQAWCGPGAGSKTLALRNSHWTKTSAKTYVCYRQHPGGPGQRRGD